MPGALVTVRAQAVAPDYAAARNFTDAGDVAIEALRDALRTKRASADDLWRAATTDRVVTVMRPYLEQGL